MPESDILSAVEELARTIQNAKAEIASLRVSDIRTCDIPSATDELDAIVSHTAGATNDILGCCEMLDSVATRVPADVQEVMENAITKIYEACSFQDITGQRLAKVVTTLRQIDMKVGRILLTFGQKQIGGINAGAVRSTMDDELLNGPQLPDRAMSQASIDALLSP